MMPGDDRLRWTVGSNGIKLRVEFGHAGKVRPAGAAAEFDELLEVRLIFVARPAIVLVDVKILLQQNGNGRSWSRAGSKMIAVLQHQHGEKTAYQ